MRLSRLLVVVGATAALLAPALPASAAHEGNNKAELVGAGGATGIATVNFVKGRDAEQWTARTSVQGLPAGTYEYVLIAPSGSDAATVCTFSAIGQGSAGCSSSGFDTGGFLTAEIRDADTGAVLAQGTFARRGNCRSPQQGGTQCDAPGHQD